jgi:bifunctional ADP-heptose synthase (sugar kinase/adenylyltransferase)
MIRQKSLPYQRALGFFFKFREAGKRIVQCLGAFDAFHHNLLRMLEAARAKGDGLVVTLPSEACFEEDPEPSNFSDALWSKNLEALEWVDHVVVAPHRFSAAAIECIGPPVYCRNNESAKFCRGGLTGDRCAEDLEILDILEILDVLEAFELLRRIGEECVVLDDDVFGSTRRVQDFFKRLPQEVRSKGRALAKQSGPAEVIGHFDAMSKLRVLVLGDTIFDRYNDVQLQGLTSKNRTMSDRLRREHTDPGGGLAVAKHLRQFTPHVRKVRMFGFEPWLDDAVGAHLSAAEDLFERDSRISTVVKRRYVEPDSDEKEMVKLFSVDYIDAGPPHGDVVEWVLHNLETAKREVDQLVVTVSFTR